ncbi:glycerophosphodiester phosphodiesterase family protein [Saccharopolyspora sp. NPDC002376]
MGLPQWMSSSNGCGWFASSPIAHRGLHDDACGRPENSLPAFRFAADRDIPFELDVQLTSDGVPVVVHDGTVVDSDGSRFAVAEQPWSRLRKLRTGTAGEPIPQLFEALEAVDGRVPIVLDVRRWTLDTSRRLEKTVVGALRGYRGPVALQSFDPLAVWNLRRLTTDRPIGQISGLLHSRSPIVSAIGRTMLTNFATSPDFITYELAALPSRFAEFWRARKIPLIAFTVTSAADAQRAAGVADNFFFSGFAPPA